MLKQYRIKVCVTLYVLHLNVVRLVTWRIVCTLPFIMLSVSEDT